MRIKFSLIAPLCLLLLLLSGAANTACGQKLTTFVEQKRLGYKNARGRVVIPARFLLAGDFSRQGLAIVVDDQGWALINRAGAVVIRTPFLFDGGPDDFVEGLARFTDQGKFGFFDRTGRTIIAPQYDFALSFSEGLAAVCAGCRKTADDGEGHYSIVGGRWGYIDRRGRVVIPLRYEEADSFKKGRARVLSGGKPRFIDKKAH